MTRQEFISTKQLLKHLLVERLKSVSFSVMVIISALIVACIYITYIYPFKTPFMVKYSTSTNLLNNFSGFLLFLYIMISCYKVIGKRQNSGELLLLFRYPIKRKKIFSSLIFTVILDCTTFLFTTFVISIFVILIVFAFKWNTIINYSVPNVSGFSLVKLHSILPNIIKEYSILYGIFILFSPFLYILFIWLSFKQSLLYVFVGGISYIFFIVIILTLLSFLFISVFKSEKAILDVNLITGIFDIRYWEFLLYTEIMHYYINPDIIITGDKKGNGGGTFFICNIIQQPLYAIVLYNIYLALLVIVPSCMLWYYPKYLNKHFCVK